MVSGVHANVFTFFDEGVDQLDPFLFPFDLLCG